MAAYSTLITAVVARLTYHSASSGRLLHGCKMEYAPVQDIEGPKDLPAIRVFPPNLTETFRRKQAPLSTVELGLQVAVARSVGLAALCVQVEKVLDALEIKTDGTGDIDAMLGAELREPFSATVTARGLATDIALIAQVSLTMKPRVIAVRGKRRL